MPDLVFWLWMLLAVPAALVVVLYVPAVFFSMLGMLGQFIVLTAKELRRLWHIRKATMAVDAKREAEVTPLKLYPQTTTSAGARESSVAVPALSRGL